MPTPCLTTAGLAQGAALLKSDVVRRDNHGAFVRDKVWGYGFRGRGTDGVLRLGSGESERRRAAVGGGWVHEGEVPRRGKRCWAFRCYLTENDVGPNTNLPPVLV